MALSTVSLTIGPLRITRRRSVITLRGIVTAKYNDALTIDNLVGVTVLVGDVFDAGMRKHRR